MFVQDVAKPFGNPLLKGFYEVELPDPVSYAPATTAAYVLIAAVAAALLWFAWARYRRWRADRYRREALAVLAAIEERARRAETRVGALREVPLLLKETALAAFPRTEVAELTGPPWLAFLDETGGGDAFSRGSGRLLVSGAYRTSGDYPADSVREVLALATGWVNDHRPGAE